MTEWKDIHPDLTSELQWEWYNRKFTAEQTQEWINIGLKPADYQFVTYLRDILSFNAEDTLNFGDLENLREQHQEYLKYQATNSEEEDETQTLANAIRLSLGIFNPDDLKLSDAESEKYLSEKRLDLKKYFVFNIQELTTEKARDGFGYTAHNGRLVKQSLSEDLTQLAIAHGWDDRETKSGQRVKKSFLILNKANGSLPSQWENNDLDKKITNGAELYILFEKDSNWVDWKGWVHDNLPETNMVNVRTIPSLYLKNKKDTLKLLRKNEFECQAVSCPKEKITDYCLYHQTCLAKFKEKEDIPNIQEIDTFETWFNGNCGYVINEDNTKYPFHIWLIIYEPENEKVDEYWAIMRFWKQKNLTEAQEKAREVKKELQKKDMGVNPFSLIHWKANKYTTFADLVRKPYVRRIKVPCEKEETERTWEDFCGDDTLAKSSLLEKDVNIFEKIKIPVANKNPSDYLKPLDVVWVGKSSWGVSFYHVGVYLGNNEVCHFSSKSGKREDDKTIITDWKTFVEGCVQGEIFAYHPVLPFKHYELIAQQIDWAKANDYDEGWYCLPNNNCEHHANSFVFGIDYSRQVKEREPLFWPRSCKICDSCRREIINNGKGSTIKLTEEIKETNSKLKKLTGCWYDQIKNQYEAKTVVAPCKMM